MALLRCSRTACAFSNALRKFSSLRTIDLTCTQKSRRVQDCASENDLRVPLQSVPNRATTHTKKRYSFACPLSTPSRAWAILPPPLQRQLRISRLPTRPRASRILDRNNEDSAFSTRQYPR